MFDSMSNKMIIAILAVVIIVCAGIGAAFAFGGSGNNSSEGVVYHGNGGSTADGKVEVTHGSHTVDANIFVRSGYLFVSWNTQADGSGKTYKSGDSIEYGSGKTVDLYAIWDKEYVITAKQTVVMGNLEFYYGEDKLGYDGVRIPETGEITIVIKTPEGAKVEVDEESKDIITYTLDGVTYGYLMFAKGSAKEPVCHIDDGVLKMTVVCDHADINISYVESHSE